MPLEQGEQYRMKQPHVLIGSFGWKSTEVTVPLCPGSYRKQLRQQDGDSEVSNSRTLYSTRPLSTSQIVTVRSAPPTATRLPPSSLLHAPRLSVLSKPAGAPKWEIGDARQSAYVANLAFLFH